VATPSIMLCVERSRLALCVSQCERRDQDFSLTGTGTACFANHANYSQCNFCPSQWQTNGPCTTV